MMARRLIGIFVFVAILPLSLHVLWLLVPQKKQTILILNKLDSQVSCQVIYQSLNHIKIFSSDSSERTQQKFNKLKINNSIKSGSLFNQKYTGLNQVAAEVDICLALSRFYTNDTCFIFNKLSPKKSLLDSNTFEIAFLRKVRQNNGLILLEKNAYCDADLERNFENFTGVYSKGWRGRYFSSLDTNKANDIPSWIIRRYLNQNNGVWPYSKSGIILYNQWAVVVVLEDKNQLSYPVPKIVSSPSVVNTYNLIDTVDYCQWFELTYCKKERTNILSNFKITCTAKGDSILDLYNIPNVFPALYQSKSHLKEYYLAGSFSHGQVNPLRSKFKFTGYLDHFLDNNDASIQTNKYIWKYYIPLLQSIVYKDGKASL